MKNVSNVINTKGDEILSKLDDTFFYVSDRVMLSRVVLSGELFKISR